MFTIALTVIGFVWAAGFCFTFPLLFAVTRNSFARLPLGMVFAVSAVWFVWPLIVSSSSPRSG